MSARLPIYDLKEEIIARLATTRRLVLQAPTGSGKSTQVPQILLRHGLAGDGRIVTLQPRRLAARLLARRVAEEMGVELGREVGYQVALKIGPVLRPGFSSKQRASSFVSGFEIRRFQEFRRLSSTNSMSGISMATLRWPTLWTSRNGAVRTC